MSSSKATASRAATTHVSPRAHLYQAFQLAWPLAAFFALFTTLLEWAMGEVRAHHAIDGSLHFALIFVAWDLAMNGFVSMLSLRGAHRAGTVMPASVLPVSVLVAAWNEESSVVATVRSVLAQTGVALEVLIGDDGSTDKTRALLLEAFALVEAEPGVFETPDARVRLFALPHRGKGYTLEALRLHAKHPVLITVDADTVLGEGALVRLASSFGDALVEAAAGSVVVRAPRGALTHFQFAEYLRNTFLRRGWSEGGVLEQVPGALAAIRASSLAQAGGFPVDSITEDYEVAYRLYARAAEEGRTIRIPTIPSARAYTDPPRTIAGLIRQRTRWFAGFLTTFWRFRRLLFSARAGSFGLVRLPIKLTDALLPILGLASLITLLVALVSGTLQGNFFLSGTSLALLVVRALADLSLHRLSIRAHLEAEGRIPELETTLSHLWLYALLDAWTYGWLRHLIVMRAYPFAYSKARNWERSRD
jgi:cellulose synthase/poly-beta-1,6-N-acetylglucosamine synthase-like glycosyltransferase